MRERVREGEVRRRGGGRRGELASAPDQAALRNAGAVGHPAPAAAATVGSTWNIQAADTAAIRTELAVLGEAVVVRHCFGEACGPATTGTFVR